MKKLFLSLLIITCALSGGLIAQKKSEGFIGVGMCVVPLIIGGVPACPAGGGLVLVLVNEIYKCCKNATFPSCYASCMQECCSHTDCGKSGPNGSCSLQCINCNATAN